MVGRRQAIADSAVATGKGDDGTTGLLYGGRIAKDDPRTDAYGTLDEAVAALGVARAEATQAGLTDLGAEILRHQRGLFAAAAELAVNPDARDRLQPGISRVSEEMLIEVEDALGRWESAIVMPREFVVPGETRASAALELARTILRRAERNVVGLTRAGTIESEWLVPYINRLADLIWVLARAAEQAEGQAATPSREP